MPFTLSRYISRHFLINVAIVIGVILSLVLLFDSFELIRRASGKGVPFRIVMEMAFLKLPHMMLEISPFAILLGAILTFSKLTRTSELIVVRAAGISVWQFIMPPVIVSFIIGVILITILNPLSSAMLARFETIEGRHLKGQTSMLAVSATGLWLRQHDKEKGQNAFIHALRVAQQDMTLYDVMIWVHNDQHEFEYQMVADSAILQEGYWQLSNVHIDGPDHLKKSQESYQLPTNLEPSQIQESFAPPETVSFWELPHFIDTLKNAGFSALNHILHFYTVLVSPLLLCAMVFIAATFSLSLPRHGRTGRLMVAGILTGFFIYFISDLVAAIGLSGSIPIMLAAWTPVVICILLGMVMLLHMEDG